MNFLAHLYLAKDDDDLMLGALLGDFVRGRRAMWTYPYATREGIRLHRRIDKITDQSSQVKSLRRQFPKEFRRYAGIVIDIAFDYELARIGQVIQMSASNSLISRYGTFFPGTRSCCLKNWSTS